LKPWTFFIAGWRFDFVVVPQAWLANPLTALVSFPNNAYLFAVASAFLTTLACVPLWRRWCIRVGLVDDPGHRKIHDLPIPLAGGLGVITGLLVPLLVASVWLMLQSPPNPESVPPVGLTGLKHSSVYLLGYGFSHRGLELAGILTGAGGMLLLGLFDDKYELRAGLKFSGQVLVALLVAASGTRITLFVPSVIFSYAITILWILTLVNAFNFMDNMNGLCAGLGAIAAWYFAGMAAANGQYLVALIAFQSFGALLGFLPFNFPRASAFLGDSGSHLTGYILAILAILPHFYTSMKPSRWVVLTPLLVLLVPLLDMAWVVVLRWRLGRPVYIGDTNHLSHRLLGLGLTQTQAVLVIWILAAAAGALAYLLRR
jgi:UDP-GlcNAc:undecaprenyl-phosphate/decaprenyl-phosphate GlcNAc-1-phosphate transferase